MEPWYAELLGKLEIYEREYKRYTKCLCRGIEVLISNRPEELVRQALLFYLLYESGLYPEKITIKVEHKELDIAIYGRISDINFQPLSPPLVIIEVKRGEANLLNHVSQLHSYMKEQRTDVGLLFNGKEIITYENYLSCMPVKRNLKSLNDIRGLIQRVTDTGQDKSHTTLFQQAKDGDVNSFIDIVNLFGRRALNQITFVLKNSSEHIVGCFFRIEGQTIHYELYGKYSRKTKLYFHLDEFDKLVSVIY